MKPKWIALLALLTLALLFIRLPRQTTTVSHSPLAKASVPSTSAIQPSGAPSFKEWLASPTDLQQGHALAEARRETMRALIKENPAQALAESLSWSQWLAVPAEFRPFLERPFSA